MTTEPDYVTVLKRVDGLWMVATMKYSARTGDFEPVAMSEPFDTKALAENEGRWRASRMGKEYR